MPTLTCQGDPDVFFARGSYIWCHAIITGAIKQKNALPESLLKKERKAHCSKGLDPPAQLCHQAGPILINSGGMRMLAFS